MKAKLILENGMTFEGKPFGYLENSVGEVVFNTGMTGYQEILTDPSYFGQIVTMTYPLIGNYGVNLEDVESSSPKVKGLIVREISSLPSNFRCEMSLENYLQEHKIVGLAGIDTRALTKILRSYGTMRGIITLNDENLDDVKPLIEQYDNTKAVSTVSTKRSYTLEGRGKHVAVIDFGVKNSIIKNFQKRDCKVTIFNCHSTATDILSVNPDLVFLSNGPGDPSDLSDVINEIKILIGKIPLIGICLGHQLLAIALGGKTSKLQFGHRGCNHPVKDLEENKVFITSQNHGYYVSQLPKDMEVTHISVNDGTIEGMRHNSLPIFSVQFHPEANPGPKDMEKIFDKFLA